jgi:hypothetical protein
MGDVLRMFRNNPAALVAKKQSQAKGVSKVFGMVAPIAARASAPPPTETATPLGAASPVPTAAPVIDEGNTRRLRQQWQGGGTRTSGISI